MSDHESAPKVAPQREPRAVAITGASGMLGGALVKALRAQGIEVRTIGRGNSSDIPWDPARQLFDQSSLEGVDSVVHLAGSNIGERWTARSRAAILESRVQGTTLIAGAVARMSPKPEVLLSASAMGYYGSRGDEWLNEASAPGNDYLAEVCRAWEASTQPARDAGVRVVNLRTGIVLAREGGALAKMLLPFQLGAGGKLGSGTQWMSWISLADWVGAVLHAMRTPSITGPMNVSSPEPVTNATFTETLGRILRRPTIATVPAFALKTMFGEMAEATLLASQRMKPRVLETTHYPFQHPTLSSALRSALGEA